MFVSKVIMNLCNLQFILMITWVLLSIPLDVSKALFVRKLSKVPLNNSEPRRTLQRSSDEKLNLIWSEELGDCKDVTLDMCRQNESQHTTAWNATCYVDTNKYPPEIRLCATLCVSKSKAKQRQCEDACPDYIRTCSSMAAAVSLTTAQNVPEEHQFPYSEMCNNITTKKCRKYSQNKTHAWHVACFNNTSHLPPIVQSCWFICRTKLSMCEDFCQEFKLMCMPESSKSIISDEEKARYAVKEGLWPYGPIQCNVTLDMCKQHRKTQSEAWDTTCFRDTSHVFKPQVRLCSDVCSENTGHQSKCEDYCKDYMKKCSSSKPLSLASTNKSTQPQSMNDELLHVMHREAQVSAKVYWILAIVGLPFACVILCCCHKNWSSPPDG